MTNPFVVVNLDVCDDPFENFYLKADDYRGEEKISLENPRKGSFGQYWTVNEDKNSALGQEGD